MLPDVDGIGCPNDELASEEQLDFSRRGEHLDWPIVAELDGNFFDGALITLVYITKQFSTERSSYFDMLLGIVNWVIRYRTFGFTQQSPLLDRIIDVVTIGKTQSK